MRLGLGSGNSSDTMNPATATQNFMQSFIFARGNCLTEIGPDGSLVPELSESWEAQDGARTWVFDLRKEVTFHNGKSLTPKDVIATINFHRADGSKSAMKPVMDQIESIAADGPSRFVVKLNQPNADFAHTLSEYQIIILPEGPDGVDWQSGTGTGGYALEVFEPGVRAIVKRNPNYWKPGAAHFDSVELISIKDASARVSAVLGGQVDVADRVDFKTAGFVQSRPGVKVLEVAGAQHYSFAMNVTKPPFDSVDVRLALKYAIDRQQLVDTILLGHGFLGNDQPIGPSYRYFASDIPQRAYDPERARHHLKNAGMETVEVSLSAADAAFAGAVDAATLFSEQASKAGIRINVVREPNDGYFANVWKVKPFSAVYWRGRATEDWMLSTTYAAGAPWNDTAWSNEQFNKVLVEARGELDDAKRREMYKELQRLLADDGGAIIPMFANYLTAVSDGIGHPEKVATNSELDGTRIAERWWFS